MRHPYDCAPAAQGPSRVSRLLRTLGAAARRACRRAGQSGRSARRATACGCAVLALVAAALAGPAALPAPVRLPADQQAWLDAHGPIVYGLTPIAWPPLEVPAADGQQRGLTADMLHKLERELGLRIVRRQFADREALQQAVRDGRVDMLGSQIRPWRRDHELLYTQPYLDVPRVVVARRDDRSIRHVDDVAGRTVAVERGAPTMDALRARLANVVFLQVAGTREALEAVAARQADAYIGNAVTVSYLLHDGAAAGLEIRTDAGVAPLQIRFAVRRDLQPLQAILDHGLNGMHQDAARELLAPWLVVTRLTGVDARTLLLYAGPAGVALAGVLTTILLANRRLRREIAERREAQHALSRQAAFQTALLDQLPFPIAFKNEQARFVLCNRAYEELAALPRDALLGRTLLEASHMSRQARRAVYETECRLIRTGGRERTERVVRMGGKAQRRVLVDKLGLPTVDGRPGLLTVLMDVTEMRAAERAKDQKALARIDMDFHWQFMAHCPNAYLRAGYDVIRWQLVALRHRSPIDNAVPSHKVLVDAVGAGDAHPTRTRTLQWTVPGASTLRLHQLLAEAGYLPLTWTPSGDDAPRSTAAQARAAVDPPDGSFRWTYPDTPPELTQQWKPDQVSEITRGAVMMFQDEHGLDVDAIAGPAVWKALIADTIAGKRHKGGYSYVYVHRQVPQKLTLWHDGKVILTSPGNTGVPAAPTELGTFPVFEHLKVTTMSGTNPDGSHYNDPGVKWVSYFNGGDALHAFPRASFGTPQSLGCVELPEDAAAKVWPYTPIGTLVTIEN